MKSETSQNDFSHPTSKSLLTFSVNLFKALQPIGINDLDLPGHSGQHSPGRVTGRGQSSGGQVVVRQFTFPSCNRPQMFFLFCWGLTNKKCNEKDVPSVILPLNFPISCLHKYYNRCL